MGVRGDYARKNGGVMLIDVLSEEDLCEHGKVSELCFKCEAERKRARTLSQEAKEARSALYARRTILRKRK